MGSLLGRAQPVIPPNEHNSLGSSGNGNPGKSIGRELSPKVKEIEPSGFQQNVRLEILKLAPQELNQKV